MSEASKPTKIGRKRTTKKDSSPQSPTEAEQDGAEYSTSNEDMASINRKLDKIIASLESMDTRLTGLEVKFQEVTSNVKSQNSEIEDLKAAMADMEQWRQTIVPLINNRADVELQ